MLDFTYILTVRVGKTLHGTKTNLTDITLLAKLTMPLEYAIAINLDKHTLHHLSHLSMAVTIKCSLPFF